MSDPYYNGSSRGSSLTPHGYREETYRESKSRKSSGGYLDPYYPSSSRGQEGSPFKSIPSSNKSARPSDKSGKRSKAKEVVINNSSDNPTDPDRYNKTQDPRYWKNSFHGGDEQKYKDSLARKDYDPRYWR